MGAHKTDFSGLAKGMASFKKSEIKKPKSKKKKSKAGASLSQIKV